MIRPQLWLGLALGIVLLPAVSGALALAEDASLSVVGAFDLEPALAPEEVAALVRLDGMSTASLAVLIRTVLTNAEAAGRIVGEQGDAILATAIGHSAASRNTVASILEGTLEQAPLDALPLVRTTALVAWHAGRSSLLPPAWIIASLLDVTLDTRSIDDDTTAAALGDVLADVIPAVPAGEQMLIDAMAVASPQQFEQLDRAFAVTTAPLTDAQARDVGAAYFWIAATPNRWISLDYGVFATHLFGRLSDEQATMAVERLARSIDYNPEEAVGGQQFDMLAAAPAATADRLDGLLHAFASTINDALNGPQRPDLRPWLELFSAQQRAWLLTELAVTRPDGGIAATLRQSPLPTGLLADVDALAAGHALFSRLDHVSGAMLIDYTTGYLRNDLVAFRGVLTPDQSEAFGELLAVTLRHTTDINQIGTLMRAALPGDFAHPEVNRAAADRLTRSLVSALLEQWTLGTLDVSTLADDIVRARIVFDDEQTDELAAAFTTALSVGSEFDRLVDNAAAFVVLVSERGADADALIGRQLAGAIGSIGYPFTSILTDAARVASRLPAAVIAPIGDAVWQAVGAGRNNDPVASATALARIPGLLTVAQQRAFVEALRARAAAFPDGYMPIAAFAGLIAMEQVMSPDEVDEAIAGMIAYVERPDGYSSARLFTQEFGDIPTPLGTGFRAALLNALASATEPAQIAETIEMLRYDFPLDFNAAQSTIVVVAVSRLLASDPPIARLDPAVAQLRAMATSLDDSARAALNVALTTALATTRRPAVVETILPAWLDTLPVIGREDQGRAIRRVAANPAAVRVTPELVRLLPNGTDPEWAR